MDTKILEQILAELKAGNATTALGFGHPPKARYIYANRSNPPHLWYMWSGNDNAPIQIEHDALTGKIVKLEVETKEFRGKTEPKVNLTIKADRTYIIQAGFDTLFAKGLLYSLASDQMRNFDKLWTIAVEPGETEQVLFCRIYDPATGESIYAPYPDDVDWSAVAAIAQAKLGQSASAPEVPPVAAAMPKAKPVVGKLAAKSVEPAVVDEEDDSIEYEFTIDYNQGELIQHRGQKEFSDSIVAMTTNSSAVLGAELAEAAASLGICYGQLETNFETQLKRLNAAIKQIRENAKATWVSTDKIKSGLGAPSGDCTLAVLTAYAESIAPPKVLEEVSF